MMTATRQEASDDRRTGNWRSTQPQETYEATITPTVTARSRQIDVAAESVERVRDPNSEERAIVESAPPTLRV